MANPKASEEMVFVNEVRLKARQWALAFLLTLTLILSVPAIWKRIERFETGPDYRIPYTLSKDYWLYQRRLDALSPSNVVLLGDSVIWGEYVRPDATLSHFLSEQSAQPGRFVNGGVNGLFPLAFDGLICSYGTALHDRKVIVHCNLLWMSSPKADLQTTKEERFNHADLVPQFRPRIPCYKADLNQRLAAVVERHFTFAQWSTHLQMAYFGQKSILGWTLEEDGSDPPRYPNATKNPLRQITLTVPTEPAVDPERGVESARHRPWSTTGEGSTRFDWVPLEQSLQWAAFQRLVRLLQERGNDVFVVVGPFNERIMAPENRPAFRVLRNGAANWLENQKIEHVVPETLPSPLYADASHPLTEGYQQLAADLWNAPAFQRWVGKEARP